MKRFAYGCVATIMAINATEAGHVVEKRAIARAKPTTESSMKQPSSPLTEQQRAYYETQRVEVRELIGQAHTIWDIEQFLQGSAEHFGGVLVDDEGNHVRVQEVIDAIQTADEDLYDAVAQMTSLEEVENMRMTMPEALRNFSAITEKMADVMRKQAKLAFMYTHDVPFDTHADAGIRSSVQKENVFGEDVVLHTINPRVLGDTVSSDYDPVMIQPGFATTPETYKRFAVSIALRDGRQVTVVDLKHMDVDMSKQTDLFGGLPPLPQAYALAAQRGIERVSDGGQKKVDVVAYSLGGVGAAAAIAHNPAHVDTLTLWNPVGLYNDVDWGETVRGIQLTSDVISKHGKQVEAESQKSVRAQRVHEDIVGEVTQRSNQETFRNPFNSLNFFKLGSSFETVDAELRPILQEIGTQVDVTVIAAADDAFAPLGEMMEQLDEVPVTKRVVHDWSHSTMKYKQGEAAYMVNGILMQRGDHK